MYTVNSDSVNFMLNAQHFFPGYTHARAFIHLYLQFDFRCKLMNTHIP